MFPQASKNSASSEVARWITSFHAVSPVSRNNLRKSMHDADSTDRLQQTGNHRFRGVSRRTIAQMNERRLPKSRNSRNIKDHSSNIIRYRRIFPRASNNSTSSEVAYWITSFHAISSMFRNLLRKSMHDTDSTYGLQSTNINGLRRISASFQEFDEFRSCSLDHIGARDFSGISKYSSQIDSRDAGVAGRLLQSCAITSSAASCEILLLKWTSGSHK